MEIPNHVREPKPDIYLSDNYLVVDFECTNKEFGTALSQDNRLILSCYNLGRGHPRGRQSVTCWGSEFEQQELVRDIELADYVVAHNTKYELGWLKRCGLDLRRVLPFDTMIGEKILHGNIKVPLSLEAAAQRRGLGCKDSTASAFIRAGVCPSEIPRDMLEAYCTQDVALTQALFLAQRAELQSLGLLPVAYCRNLVTPVLADIEFNGMMLDPGRVSKTYDKYIKAYNELTKEFEVFTGGINFRSPKQVREYMYGNPNEWWYINKSKPLGFTEVEDYRGNAVKTAAGEAKTDKGTISALQATTPEQKEFKRLAGELAKLKVPVQNLKKMKAICEANPNDPRMFFTFNQTVTATDRLSSTARGGGLQGQNIDSAFKRLFRARAAGRRISEADAKQLEFRMAVHLGRCRQGLDDVCSGMDVHQASADYHGVTRKAAKARTFRPLFGGKSGTPRERRYIDYFVKRYDGISRAQASWAMRAVRDKFIVTETGYRFYFPEATISQSGYIKGTTEIYNFPIQQTSTADFIPLAVCLLWHACASYGDSVLVLNTIHDSVIADVAEEVLPEYYELVKWAFTDGAKEMMKKLYGIELIVPLGVEINNAEHWNDTDVKLDHDPGVTKRPKAA